MKDNVGSGFEVVAVNILTVNLKRQSSKISIKSYQSL